MPGRRTSCAFCKKCRIVFRLCTSGKRKRRKFFVGYCLLYIEVVGNIRRACVPGPGRPRSSCVNSARAPSTKQFLPVEQNNHFRFVFPQFKSSSYGDGDFPDIPDPGSFRPPRKQSATVCVQLVIKTTTTTTGKSPAIFAVAKFAAFFALLQFWVVPGEEGLASERRGCVWPREDLSVCV